MHFVSVLGSYMADSMIAVEVVYALPQLQRVVQLEVPEGTTVRQVAELSELAQEFAELDIAQASLGVFGKVIPKPDERLVEAGERVEIYRPLLADPKEVRKQRAARAAQERAKQSARED